MKVINLEDHEARLAKWYKENNTTPQKLGETMKRKTDEGRTPSKIVLLKLIRKERKKACKELW